jgi:hypothetical protein
MAQPIDRYEGLLVSSIYTIPSQLLLLTRVIFIVKWVLQCIAHYTQLICE